MKLQKLLHKNIVFYNRYYRLVMAAVVIATGVTVGSLAVGSSVRTTLVRRVTERLGDTETIIFSRNSFMAQELADALQQEGSTRGILLVNGFVSYSGRLIPVTVWGVDDMSIEQGGAKINAELANELELNVDAGANLVLRLPASGLIPQGSLFVTDSYTTSMRLALSGITDVDDGGNLNLKNEQTIPLNIFVNRHELADVMDAEQKINLIMTNRLVAEAEFEKVWSYSSSGISVNKRETFSEIVSDRVFLHDSVTAAICRDNQQCNRLFSYLANSIESKGASIPYSFVTALDNYDGELLQSNDIILSDYAANHLQAKAGDTVRLTYFTSHNLKTLTNDTILLKVKKIVPLAHLLNDKSLSAEFPGLSDVERCTDWDSDMPINMDLITDDDERYWELYRNTPKALVGYSGVVGDWGNAYGNATAVHLDGSLNLAGLRANMFGIHLIYPRESGVFAAKNGVDFAGLFLALGFFIIVSASLLMLVPLSEMLYRRRREVALLKALGYLRKHIIRMLWREAAPAIVASAAVGVVAGLLYTATVMWLLGNVWKGATHTDGFAIYPDAITLIAGFVVGTALSLSLLRIAIVRSLRTKRQHIGTPKISVKKLRITAVASSIVSIAIIIYGILFLHSVALFIIAGITLICTAALWGNYIICKNTLFTNKDAFADNKMVWNTLFAGRQQAALSFFALAMGVFTVFSVGLNRKDFSDATLLRSGTGGYSFWCETGVPVYHNLTTDEGRLKLSLTNLPAGAEVLQCLRYSADDASCLNLNRVQQPTVLGIDMKMLAAGDFAITQSLYPLTGDAAFSRMTTMEGIAYPALVDATVLTWGLMMSIGDTLWYEADGGQTIPIILAGTLANSVFQGNLLIDRTFFSQIWRETAGSEIFLLKTAEQNLPQTKVLVEQALNEYGIRVTTTNDRLKQFNTVTDTYLTIFMTLGCLGLLLGVFSFVIVVRKNLSMRRHEIELYQTLGFTTAKVGYVIYRENLMVPLYAIATGAVSSIVGAGGSIAGIGVQIWIAALLFTCIFTAAVIVFVRKEVRNEVRLV
ncbi:MAG: FtsX-like permease family protein [Cytophagaceae bacterium]|jgi:putative ABC transport system permease protein|nr:FtsX-like permease family protein [Cytophagaceae bacterium]